MTYLILCRVSGGITGTREAWLKDKDGCEVRFTDREKAETEARRLSDRRNGNPYRTADFSYRVVASAVTASMEKDGRD